MYHKHEVRTLKKTKNKEIKDFMQLKNLDNQDMALFFNMPYNSFTNKLNQREFKLNEIIKLLNSQNCHLAILDEQKTPIIIFNTNEKENND